MMGEVGGEKITSSGSRIRAFAGQEADCCRQTLQVTRSDGNIGGQDELLNNGDDGGQDAILSRDNQRKSDRRPMSPLLERMVSPFRGTYRKTARTMRRSSSAGDESQPTARPESPLLERMTSPVRRRVMMLMQQRSTTTQQGPTCTQSNVRHHMSSPSQNSQESQWRSVKSRLLRALSVGSSRSSSRSSSPFAGEKLRTLMQRGSENAELSETSRFADPGDKEQKPASCVRNLQSSTLPVYLAPGQSCNSPLTEKEVCTSRWEENEAGFETTEHSSSESRMRWKNTILRQPGAYYRPPSRPSSPNLPV